MGIVELRPWRLRALLAVASGLTLAAGAFGCTTPQPLYPADAGGRIDAPGLDAPTDPDVPIDPDGSGGTDAPSIPDAALLVDAPTPPTDAPGSNGSSCVDGVGECVSGFCVDGVCCASACIGACQACAAALTGAPSGTCAPVTAGTDPSDECVLAPPTSCSTDGMCDGVGACRRYAAGTACSSATCSGSAQFLPPRTCDGAGLCQLSTVVSCGSYRCRGSACLTSCSGSIDCASGANCMGNRCVGSGAPGQPCSTAGECISGFCVDDVCCQSACTGLCSRCDGTGTVALPGTCAPIECSDPDNECGGAAPICTSGTCGTMLTC